MSNKWIGLIIVAGLFALFVPVAYKFGQGMARDGMDKALAEKAKMDETLMANLPARGAVGERFETATEAGANLVWYEIGAGNPIVMFASAGREASDFNELAQALVQAGYKAVMIQAPGIDGAKATADAPDMFGLAADAAPIIIAQGEPVVVLGHAFGNRVARATAAKYPRQVRGAILVASGGPRAVPDKANEALKASFNPLLPINKRREDVRYAFFANGNAVPDHWMRGWYGRTAQMQGKAKNARIEEWLSGGEGPMLVIAGMQDRIAPPEDTIDLLEADYPTRVTGVRIERAGHALLPEQPEKIAEAIINWLNKLD